MKSEKDTRTSGRKTCPETVSGKKIFIFNFVKIFPHPLCAAGGVSSWSEGHPGACEPFSLDGTMIPETSGPCPGWEWRGCDWDPGQRDLWSLPALAPPGDGRALWGWG